MAMQRAGQRIVNGKTEKKSNMQVFVPYQQPFEVATDLDTRRLNKQIIECRQILAAIRGESNAWKNHPVVKMYRDHVVWLEYYMFCLECMLESHRMSDLKEYDELDELTKLSLEWSNKADAIRPPFLTEEFCAQHRNRLYTKDPEYYNYPDAEVSHENWYVVDGELLRYEYGKQIKE